MSDPPAFDADDTGRIRAEAARAPTSDPASELRGLTVGFLAHEQSDTRRWRFAAWVAGMLITAALGAIGVAWDAHASAAAQVQRVEDMREHVDHIESQVDRLVERSDP